MLGLRTTLVNATVNPRSSWRMLGVLLEVNCHGLKSPWLVVASRFARTWLIPRAKARGLRKVIKRGENQTDQRCRFWTVRISGYTPASNAKEVKDDL